MMNEPILELNGVNKKINDSFALSDINLQLYPGEVQFIVGENGSGKSSIVKVVSGQMIPDSGELLIDGKVVKLNTVADAYRHSLVYTTQNFTPFTYLSVAENIFFNVLPYKNSLIKNIDYEKLYSDCFKLIKEFNLPFSVDDEVEHLGLAQRQLIDFLRAYVSNAKIVILDEPTTLLTDYESGILFTLVRKMKQRGCGIIYVSNKIKEIKEIGDRVTVVKGGKLLATLNVSDISEEHIIGLMSGSVYTNRYPKLNIARGSKLFQVSNLSCKNILDDISITLHSNEIIGITGLAGSGRTLLCNCLFGMTQCNYKEMYINGNNVKIENPYQAITNGIALLPENRANDAIFQKLGIEENVSIVSLKRFSDRFSINQGYCHSTVKSYLSQLGINAKPLDRMLEYSPGSQQKMQLAKWIMSGSKVFILDEPTRGLDIPSKIDIYNALNDLLRKGAGIIMVSSNMEELLGMCDRILVISHGEIVYNQPREIATMKDLLRYAVS